MRLARATRNNFLCHLYTLGAIFRLVQCIWPLDRSSPHCSMSSISGIARFLCFNKRSRVTMQHHKTITLACQHEDTLCIVIIKVHVCTDRVIELCMYGDTEFIILGLALSMLGRTINTVRTETCLFQWRRFL